MACWVVIGDNMVMLPIAFLFFIVAMIVGYKVIKDDEIRAENAILNDYEKAREILCEYLGYDDPEEHMVSDLVSEICKNKR